MTGFGEAATENQTYRVGATVRSVNHRFLDVVVRLFEDYRALERVVAEAVRGRLTRGRVEVRLTIDALGARPVEIEVREDVVRDLVARLEPLRAEGLVAGEVGISDLARLPQVVTLRERPPGWTDEDGELVLQAVALALEQVESGREHEGERLEVFLLGRLDELEAKASALESRRLVVERDMLSSLRERLAELIDASQIPEERLAQEAALLVERSDVREELDRLSAHLEHFRSLCAGDGPHGRRLEFLVQEIQRELNTLGGKCRDAEMTGDVVEGKLLCEQLREQLLNVE